MVRVVSRMEDSRCGRCRVWKDVGLPWSPTNLLLNTTKEERNRFTAKTHSGKHRSILGPSFSDDATSPVLATLTVTQGAQLT